MGYSERYRRTYSLLKRRGHTAAKALEIIIAAKRGDRFAIHWINCLRKTR